MLLIEQNRDGFPEPLAEEDALEGSPVVDLAMPGGFKIRADVARSLEGDYLAGEGVRLMDPTVSLARCRLVVMHQLMYRGKGREGTVLRVYGFPASEGSVPLALPAPPAAIEHDPAGDSRDLLARLEDVRLSPGGGASFAIRSAGETALVFDAFGAEKRVEPMGSAEWGVTRRKIRVRELALLASAFDPEGLPPGDPNEEVFPATDHGEVEFSTEWGALYLGTMPLVVEEPAAAGEDFR